MPRPTIIGKQLREEGVRPKRLGRKADVARYLSISDMCLWRWLRDESLDFPQPIKIGTMQLFDFDDIDLWLRKHVVKRVKKGKA